MKIIASLLLLFAIGLSGCQTPSQKEKEKKAALKKKTKVELREESSDVDFQAFVGRLRKAVAAHDVNTLAEMMTPDFGYSLNPEKFGKKGGFMVAPPQFADESLNYDGYRAGLRRVNGSWKFAYFVNG